MDLFSPRASNGSSVLFVCTGNICRSAIAAAYFNRGANQLKANSAGLHAVVGSAMDPATAAIAQRYGLDATHTARQLGPSHIEGAGLILTMTAEQRSDVLTLHPAALRRTFTLSEFALILESWDVPPPSWAEAVKVAADSRPSPNNIHLLDIADPFRQSVEFHDHTSMQIFDFVDRIRTRIRAESWL